MNFMNQISSGKALIVGVVSGIPSVTYAVVTEDFGAVVTGVALGVIALGWAIFKAMNDNRLNSILDRLDKAEALADKYRDDAIKAEAQAGQLTVELAVVKARLKQYEPHAE